MTSRAAITDALLSIARRLELEYVGIDCGETPDGRAADFRGG